MKTKEINQEVHFKARPHDVYEALMNEDKHAEFTGAEAEIDAKVGGKYMAHGGYIRGENLELVPGKLIVQSWHAEEDYFPDEYYSKITFELTDKDGGTLLKFKHEGVPESGADSIADGWVTYYWEPMKEMLER